jgi:hypothetical protein
MCEGEYMAIFNMMKDQAGKVKMAMQEENMRFMALHGQVHTYIHTYIHTHTYARTYST